VNEVFQTIVTRSRVPKPYSFVEEDLSKHNGEALWKSWSGVRTKLSEVCTMYRNARSFERSCEIRLQ
jgi:hypothetical protein